MNPHAHLIGGILFGTIGYKLGIINFNDIFIIGIIAVLIDIDHYIHYIIHYKDIRPKKFWNTTMENWTLNHGSARTFIHHFNGMAIIFPFLMIVFLLDVRIGYIGLSAYVSHMMLDHLKYFHFTITPYKEVDILGFKVMWNTTEEMLFLIMATISLMIFF